MSNKLDSITFKFGTGSDLAFAEQLWERAKRQEGWSAKVLEKVDPSLDCTLWNIWLNMGKAEELLGGLGKGKNEEQLHLSAESRLEIYKAVRAVLFFLDVLIKTQEFTRVDEVIAWITRFNDTKESQSNHQLQGEVQLCLARVRLMQGDIPACLNLVGKAFEHMSSQRAQESSEGSTTVDKLHLLGSKLELLCGKPEHALNRLLTKTLPSETSSKIAVLNNIGCLHFRLGRLGLAQLYFNKSIGHANKALASNMSNETVPRNLSLNQLLRRQRATIIYNVGLSLLHSGDAQNALECFVKVSASLRSSPYVWIRMSVCCLKLHSTKLKEITDGYQNCLLESHVEGTTRGDLFFLPRSRRWHEERLINDEGRYGLTHAVGWLKTAIGLCRAQAAKQNPLNTHRLRRLEQTAVLKLCYCLLCLQQPQESNQLLVKLLREKDLDTTTQFLASMYIAEALCMNGQAHQASQYLKFDANTCRESKVPDAVSLLYTNLATVYVLRSEINPHSQGRSPSTPDRKSQAAQCLQRALSVNRNYGYGLRLLLFLQLQSGQVSRALHLIKFRQLDSPTTS